MKARQWILIGLVSIIVLALGAGYLVEAVRASSLQDTVAYQRTLLQRQAEVLLQLRKAVVPKNYTSYEALEAWVDNWESVNKPVAVGAGKWSFVIVGSRALSSEYWDCDDVAEAMQRCAVTDGYMMSLALVDRSGKVYGVPVSNLASHAGCMAVAEGVYYYVEPFTGRITKIVGKDE